LSKQYAYTGQENLEAMKEAVNYNRYQYNFINCQIRKLKKRPKRILDFGAGIGTYADMFKDSGIIVDCVEPTPSQAKILKRKGYNVYKDIKDVNGRYDLVYVLNVLEHIKDDGKALDSLKTCLNDGGIIVVYVPAFSIIFTKLDIIAGHYRRYRIKEVKSLANNHGLFLTEVKYCDPIGFVLAIIYRIIGGSGELNTRSIYIFDKFLFPISVFLEHIFNKIFGKNILAIFTN
jgi:SAM-dependent methyltransferase